MTQKKYNPISHSVDETEEWSSTRIKNAPPDLYDPSQPRLGRRESEPHSAEVTYLRDVLATNFPEGRALWDLHHYFIAPKGVLEGKKIDLQLDVSFFKELTIPFAISSYDATMHEGKVPDIAINILSKSTWRGDISENVETCKDLSIPVYAVFSPYLLTSKRYAPPFLRTYILQENGFYKQEELRAITIEEGGTIDETQVLDLDDKLPFHLGLMRLKQQFLGGKSLFRLILIDPLEMRVLPTRREKEVESVEKKAEVAEKKAEMAEKKAEVAEKELQEYRDKFGE